MKNNKHQVYEAPQAEIIEIEPQGILCTSADTSIGGGGTQGMGMTNINWP